MPRCWKQELCPGRCCQGWRPECADPAPELDARSRCMKLCPANLRALPQLRARTGRRGAREHRAGDNRRCHGRIAKHRDGGSQRRAVAHLQVPLVNAHFICAEWVSSAVLGRLASVNVHSDPTHHACNGKDASCKKSPFPMTTSWYSCAAVPASGINGKS